MNELKDRGVGDILIAVVDGLKGFPEAITAVFPATVVQTCVVHLIRHSLEFVSWKDRKPVVPALRAIYRAGDAEAGMAALEAFEAGPWGQKYPAIALSWRRNWANVVPFFAYPESVRRIIYTTNAIEALNSKLRRAIRTRGHFPNDDAAMKLLYLVLIRRPQTGNVRLVSGSKPRRSSRSSSASASSSDDEPASRTKYAIVPKLMVILHNVWRSGQAFRWTERMARPVRKGDFRLALVSLLQRIRSRVLDPAKMEIRTARSS